VKGFTKEQVKSTAKVWNSPAKFVETMLKVFGTYTETDADVNRVADILSNLLETDVIFLFYARGLTAAVKPGEDILSSYKN
jgi:hypothetical protein